MLAIERIFPDQLIFREQLIQSRLCETRLLVPTRINASTYNIIPARIVI